MKTIARKILSSAAVSLCACSAAAVPQCTVSGSALLSFGTVVALASTGDVSSDTGNSFWLNCNAEVSAAPSIYSSSERVMTSGGSSLPFALSLVAPGSTPLPMSAPGTALGIVRNGTNQSVPLYGRIRAANFKSLPPGLYSTSIVLTIEY
jgi:spore coat protein U-like protein